MQRNPGLFPGIKTAEQAVQRGWTRVGLGGDYIDTQVLTGYLLSILQDLILKLRGSGDPKDQIYIETTRFSGYIDTDDFLSAHGPGEVRHLMRFGAW